MTPHKGVFQYAIVLAPVCTIITIRSNEANLNWNPVFFLPDACRHGDRATFPNQHLVQSQIRSNQVDCLFVSSQCTSPLRWGIKATTSIHQTWFHRDRHQLELMVGGDRSSADYLVFRREALGFISPFVHSKLQMCLLPLWFKWLVGNRFRISWACKKIYGGRWQIFAIISSHNASFVLKWRTEKGEIGHWLCWMVNGEPDQKCQKFNQLGRRCLNDKWMLI